MSHVEAEVLHLLDDGRRRRRARGHDADTARDGAAIAVGGVGQRPHDDGRAAEVSDAVIGHGSVHRRGSDAPQANMRARHCGDSPGKAPAVAVEHGQRPEINRMMRHGPGQDVADGVEIRATMVIDDALGIARGARGVVERDGLPLVGGKVPVEVGIALGEELLVGHLAEAVAGSRGGIVDIDDQRPALQPGQRLGDAGREFAVGDQDLAVGVLENEGDGVGVEADIEGVEHRARHGDAEVGLKVLGDVGRHHGDGVAHADAAALEGRGQADAAVVGLAPGATQAAVDDGGAVGKDGGGAADEGQRRQRHIVGGVLVERHFVGVRAGHGFASR